MIKSMHQVWGMAMTMIDIFFCFHLFVTYSYCSCLNAPRAMFSTKFGPIIDTKEGLELWQGCYKGVCLSHYGLDLTIGTL